MKNNILPKEFIKISESIGKNHLLVQGAGGNTSLKYSNEMWIKASGKWLAKASKENIFVSVDYKKIKNDILKNKLSIKELHLFKKSKLKPSIETSLHALMPHKVVLHSHPINVLSTITKKNFEKKLSNLMTDINWSWVPYIRPGYDLTKIVKKKLSKKIVDVIFFGNHGLIIGANNCKDCYKLMNKIINRFKTNPRKFSFINNIKLKVLAKNLKMKLPKYEISHSLALDKISFNYCKNKNGILYPDQTVFLGEKMNCFTLSQINKLRKNSFDYIIIKNIGVLISQNTKKDIDELLRGHAELLLRIKEKEKLRYLKKTEIKQLHNWDAEKFRQGKIK